MNKNLHVSRWHVHESMADGWISIWKRLDLSVRFKRSAIVICAILNLKQQLCDQLAERVDRRTKKTNFANRNLIISHALYIIDAFWMKIFATTATSHAAAADAVVQHFRLDRYHFLSQSENCSESLSGWLCIRVKAKIAIKSYQTFFFICANLIYFFGFLYVFVTFSSSFSRFRCS